MVEKPTAEIVSKPAATAPFAPLPHARAGGISGLLDLAIEQGGYDWGFLAYAVGFGGSMIWFGSSAGVALSSMYPEARSVAKWLRHGWHVAVAYAVGFFLLLGLLGFHPEAPRKPTAAPAQHAASAVP